MNELYNELQIKIERLENEITFKNGLISLLSHDSKSLFSNFLWLADAVEQKTISEEDFFKLLPQIKSDAQKNLQTVQDSTAWLKTQYGGFRIKPEKILVTDLFFHLKEKYTAKFEAKNLNFYFKGNSDTSVETDRLLLEFVLEKLVDNAIKYSLSGQNIYFQEVTDSTQVVISVIDSGTGMDSAYLSSIYSYDNPVFQGTAGETGVGLSLKIVKNFISLMNGNIQITSSEHQGTTVSIFLPKM